jgi:hypothetical protein
MKRIGFYFYIHLPSKLGIKDLAIGVEEKTKAYELNKQLKEPTGEHF